MTRSNFIVACAVACASMIATPGNATEADLQRLSGVPEPQVRVEQIDAASRRLFDEALREYDEHIERQPYDVVGQLMRCRFMDTFAGNYEYATFVDEIVDLASECRDAVIARFPEHPEVQLLQLEDLSPDELLESGAAALKRVPTQNWTQGQLARLNVLLADAADRSHDERSIDFARRALDHDERADVRELLARKLLDLGRKAEAVEVLTSSADPHDDSESWYQSTKLELLALADAREAVLALYERLRSSESYDHLRVARALVRVGAPVEARSEFARLADSGALWGVARERFRFEFDHGTSDEALNAYNRWRDSGWQQDPLAVNRVALLFRDVRLAWQPRDLLGLGGLLLALGLIAAAVSLPIALVHYRGLARRVHTHEPYPAAGWRLNHAWLALFLLGIAQILSLYGAGPMDLVSLEENAAGVSATPQQLAQVSVVMGMLAIVLLLPLGAVARTVSPQWFASRWSIGKALLIGGSIGIASRLPLLLTWAISEAGADRGTTQQELWLILEAMRDQLGVASALWFLGIYAPVIEEFVFRGVLLGALASHVRFRWANTVQASLFALAHADPQAMIPLFLLGLVSGVLAKRSGGLLASMVLHAVFNLIAGWVLLAHG